MKNSLGFSTVPGMVRVMSKNGYYASIMRAEKRKNDSEGLPEGIPIPLLPVDYLKCKPDHFLNGEGSFLCPVKSDWALWFNFSMNNPQNTAVLTSVKGMNPITGQRVNGVGLEQYNDSCPIHGVPFSHGHLCPKCGFKWPHQNYLSNDPLWLDGFRTEAGKVRQFYFTEDMAKSVPELVIGKDDTVPAFGFCFYGQKKPVEYERSDRLRGQEAEEAFLKRGYDCKWEYTSHTRIKTEGLIGLGTSDCYSTLTIGSSTIDERRIRGSADYSDKIMLCSSSYSSKEVVNAASEIHLNSVDVGVGAGSVIKQVIENDKRDINSWKDKPSSIMRIYFVFQEEFERYVERGLNDLEGIKEGYLAGLPVGDYHE